MKGPLREGVNVRHAKFGLGSTVHSDERRTVIEFEEHGTKTFVTEMLEVERTDEVPKRRAPAKKPR
jgi:hypothetical protein